MESIIMTFFMVICGLEINFISMFSETKLVVFVFIFSLQDQFDNLEKHTQWGIDVLEKYIKFVKERTEIELSYAKQLR